MKIRILTVLLGIGVFLAPALSQADTSSPARQAVARLSLTPYTLEGLEEEVLCGTLEVFENRSTRAGRKIALNVVVVPSLIATPTDAPLFFFEGGPGVAATDAVWMFVEDSSFRRTRDVVLVDIRGTGKSSPLHCDLLGDPLDLQNYLNDMYPDALVAACREQLDSIADLTQYTTPIVVEDLEDVRRWLGYDRIDVMGLSYGTRLALTYMRMHPGQIRSAVLIGPLAPSVRVPSLHAAAGQRALDLVISDCESDTACNRAFPRLREDLASLNQSFGNEGVSVTMRHPVTDAEVALRIRREIFFERIRSKMYMITGAREVPWIITRAAQGDFAPFMELIIPKDFSEPPWLAEGLYLSMTCAEDIPFIDTAAARQSYENTYFGDYRVSQQINAARHWPRGSLPPGYHEPFTSDVPTLIISGYYDPITPPSFAEEVHRLLPKSRLLSIPSMAHVPAGMTNYECITDLITRFFQIGSVDSLDASCVETMQAPPFRLSDE